MSQKGRRFLVQVPIFLLLLNGYTVLSIRILDPPSLDLSVGPPPSLPAKVTLDLLPNNNKTNPNLNQDPESVPDPKSPPNSDALGKSQLEIKIETESESGSVRLGRGVTAAVGVVHPGLGRQPLKSLHTQITSKTLDRRDKARTLGQVQKSFGQKRDLLFNAPYAQEFEQVTTFPYPYTANFQQYTNLPVLPAATTYPYQNQYQNPYLSNYFQQQQYYPYENLPLVSSGVGIGTPNVYVLREVNEAEEPGLSSTEEASNNRPLRKVSSSPGQGQGQGAGPSSNINRRREVPLAFQQQRERFFPGLFGGVPSPYSQYPPPPYPPPGFPYAGPYGPLRFPPIPPAALYYD